MTPSNPTDRSTPDGAQPGPLPGSGAPSEAQAGRDLLLLDNDERILELVQWFLERRGYRVRAAHSFDEARAAVRERRPELMLSDVDLGSKNAREELPLMGEEGLLPPTLVVSGFLSPELREHLMALPEVLDTLSKPFELSDLEECLHTCFTRLEQEPIPSRGPLPSAGMEAQASTPSADEEWIEILPHSPPGQP